VTIATAFISVLTNLKVRWDVAMTGEITLRGNVLPIGGIKEKVLAAQRAGVKKMILPAANKKDLIDIPKKVKREMEFIFVEEIKEVFDHALVKPADKINRGMDETSEPRRKGAHSSHKERVL
jgi:ATP-dependent Lon protease